MLSFPALVIGSLSPDAGYLFGEQGWGALSHRFLGSIAFCLPVGLALVVLFYVLRSGVVRMLPAPYQRALLPACQQAPACAWAVVISLLIGAWTHVLWDSFTHNDGWFVQHLPALQSVVVSVRGHTARVCHLLWYGCSFAGVIWLFVVFEKWKQTCVNGNTFFSTRAAVWDAVLVATLLLPIALVHHLTRGQRSPLYLLAALCALPALGIALKVGNSRKHGAADKP